MTVDFNALGERVRGFMHNDRKFAHVMGVYAECERLADTFGLVPDEKQQLMLAGMLHDLSKTLTPMEQTELMFRLKHRFDRETMLCPKVMHQVSGAYLSRNLFPELVDDTVFNCILTHTTGNDNMTLMQELVYLADYIEAGRRYEDCQTLRKEFWDGIRTPDAQPRQVLDRVLLRSFDMTISHMMEEKAYIHSDTFRARNHYALAVSGL